MKNIWNIFKNTIKHQNIFKKSQKKKKHFQEKYFWPKTFYNDTNSISALVLSRKHFPLIS